MISGGLYRLLPSNEFWSSLNYLTIVKSYPNLRIVDAPVNSLNLIIMNNPLKLRIVDNPWIWDLCAAPNGKLC